MGKACLSNANRPRWYPTGKGGEIVDLAALCRRRGASGAVALRTGVVVFRPELRRFCEQNTCGRYGRNYHCPPGVGSVESLIDRVKTFENAVFWQTIHPLEDSYDWEGMMCAQKQHNQLARDIATEMYGILGRRKTLVLSAGGCDLCETCGLLSKEACRHPGEGLSSLEAYGIHVADTCAAAGLPYHNGANTVTYFAGVFF